MNLLLSILIAVTTISSSLLAQTSGVEQLPSFDLFPEENEESEEEEEGVECVRPNELFVDELDELAELKGQGKDFCWCLRAGLYYQAVAANEPVSYKPYLLEYDLVCAPDESEEESLDYINPLEAIGDGELPKDANGLYPWQEGYTGPVYESPELTDEILRQIGDFPDANGLFPWEEGYIEPPQGTPTYQNPLEQIGDFPDENGLFQWEEGYTGPTYNTPSDNISLEEIGDFPDENGLYPWEEGYSEPARDYYDGGTEQLPTFDLNDPQVEQLPSFNLNDPQVEQLPSFDLGSLPGNNADVVNPTNPGFETFKIGNLEIQIPNPTGLLRPVDTLIKIGASISTII